MDAPPVLVLAEGLVHVGCVGGGGGGGWFRWAAIGSSGLKLIQVGDGGVCSGQGTGVSVWGGRVDLVFKVGVGLGVQVRVGERVGVVIQSWRAKGETLGRGVVRGQTGKS